MVLDHPDCIIAIVSVSFIVGVTRIGWCELVTSNDSTCRTWGGYTTRFGDAGGIGCVGLDIFVRVAGLALAVLVSSHRVVVDSLTVLGVWG